MRLNSQISAGQILQFVCITSLIFEFFDNVQTWAPHLSQYSASTKIHNFYEIITKLGVCVTNEYHILTNFRNDCVKIVDFLIKALYYESLDWGAHVCISKDLFYRVGHGSLVFHIFTESESLPNHSNKKHDIFFFVYFWNSL